MLLFFCDGGAAPQNYLRTTAILLIRINGRIFNHWINPC